MAGELIEIDPKTGFALVRPAMLIAVLRRLDALEATKPPALEWPAIDPIPSTTAADRLGMEPFELTERS